MPQLNVEQLLTELDELAPLVRAHAGEGDRLARLPEPIVHELRALGLLRLWIPQRYRGFELELAATLRIYEAAAAVDGSFGWAVMIGAGGGLFAAFLDPVVAGDIFGPANAVIAGSGAPDGRAAQVDGGYRVSGRWRYASGAHYATTFTANCAIARAGQPVLDAEARPLIRAMAFSSSQVTIHPAWDTSGMRGTGSHDFAVQDVFVPQQRTFSVFTDAAREPGPLYRLPFGVLTELPVAAVGLGIARHALDAFAALAKHKRCQGSDTLLAEHPIAQTRYAESDARWRLLQAGIYALAARTWQAALANRLLLPRELAEITASCALCLAELQRAIADLASLAGMSAIMLDNEFARAWRDLQALAAHGSVSPLQLLPAGRALL
jgi:alkylation response protein AidB-like acyl-CoA dehydrogenase